MDRSTDKTRTTAWWLSPSESIVLAALPVLGSLLTLAYEWAYFVYFRIPRDYIEVTLGRIAAATSLVCVPLIAGLISVSFGYADGASASVASITRRKISGALSAALAIGMLVLIFVLPDDARAVFVNGTEGVIVIGGAIYATIRFIQKFSQYREHELARTGDERDSDLLRKRAQTLLWGALTVAATAIASAFTGYSNAQGTDTYWALDESPDLLMIRKSGELLILKKYDRKTLRWLDQIALLRVEKDRPVKMTLVRIPNMERAVLPSRMTPARGLDSTNHGGPGLRMTEELRN